jgi:hypothetical protein
MGEGRTTATHRLPGWLRFVLALWAIALLLLGLQAFEVSLFSVLSG